MLNMPKENIDRAIKRGTGGLEGEKLEEVVFEAFGPAGIAIIIEGITDNKNRSLAEIKQILTQNNGKLAGEGSVKWLFERKGVIMVKNGEKEKLEMAAIEAGAEDIYWHDDILDVFTKPEDLEKVKKLVVASGFLDLTSIKQVLLLRLAVKSYGEFEAECCMSEKPLFLRIGIAFSSINCPYSLVFILITFSLFLF